MATFATILLLLLATVTETSCLQEMEVLQMAQTQVTQAMSLVENSVSVRLHGLGSFSSGHDQTGVALSDCAKLYGKSESRLSHMISDKSIYTKEDALTWVSAVMTNDRTCLDGLQEKGYVEAQVLGKNLTMLLGQVLVLYVKNKGKPKGKQSNL